MWLEEAEEPNVRLAPAQSVSIVAGPIEAAAAPAAPARGGPRVDVIVPNRRKRGRPCKCAERGIVCMHQPNKGEAQKIQTTDTEPT